MDTTGLSDWYQRVLGARVLWSNNNTPPAYLLQLDERLVIEIYPANSTIGMKSDNQSAGWRHLALRVENIESACEQLTKLGVTLGEPIKPAGGGGRVRFFSDPEGNLLHLVERPKPALFSL